MESANEAAPGLPFRNESVIPTPTLLRVAAVMVLGLALAIAVVFILKRYLFARDLIGSGKHRMQLLEVRRLSPRLILFMVRVDEKTMVLAQSGERLVALDPATAFENLQETLDEES